MAKTSIPENTNPSVEFEYISSYNLATPFGNAVQITPSQLQGLLHDGNTTKQGTYGAVLLRDSTSYIEFEVKRDCHFWATSGAYSDNGGGTGKDIIIYKLDNNGVYQVYEEAKTNNLEDWYIVSQLLKKGRYKLHLKAMYVQFNEWYFESVVKNKTLILHDGEYKKFIKKKPATTGINTTPQMTNNTTPKGIASASSIYSTNYDAWKAFDKVRLTDSSWATPSGIKTGWLSYEYKEPISITKYSIVSRHPVVDIGELPKAWTFEAWNGTRWIILDTRTNITDWVAGIEKSFSFTNTEKYIKYRINISENCGYVYVVIGELGMYEDVKPAIIPHWSTVSTTLPNQNQFLSDGMDSLFPLFNRKVAELEPMAMSDKSEILDVDEIGKVF
ncbi:hypothetical protein ACIQY2_25550, partial [Lysinibacillus sp. NPDC096396]